MAGGGTGASQNSFGVTGGSSGGGGASVGSPTKALFGYWGAIQTIIGGNVTGGGGGGGGGNGTRGLVLPNGGIGFLSSITGTPKYYAGGGGGSAKGVSAVAGNGGLGGGGVGGVSDSATGGSGGLCGTAGTNGTGGGAGGNRAAACATVSGGTGIVIVKMNISANPMPSNATGYLTTCGGITNTTAVTWSVYDIITGNQMSYNIISNMQQIYNYTLLAENFTGALNNSTNFSLCIYPNNSTAYAQTTDTITSVGYNPIQLSQIPTFYTNKTTNYTYYMLPIISSKLTQIYVVDNTYTPMLGVSVKIQQVNPLTSGVITLGTYDVDGFGSTTQPLQPASQLYHFSVLNNLGQVLQDYPNRAIPCYSTDLVCSLVLIVNPNSLPIDITSLTGSCAYDGTTRIITCTGTDTSHTIMVLNITAFGLGGSGSVCSNQSAGASGTLTCNLPNINGTYNGYFFGIDIGGYNHLIAEGTYTVGAGAPTSYGRDGFLALVMLVVIGATLMTSSIAVSMTMGIFAMFIGLVFGIVPLSIASVAIIFAIVAFVISYRLKV